VEMGYLFSLSKETTECCLNVSELILLVCGMVLAYGAAGEYLEEHSKLPRWMQWSREPRLVFVWMVAISLFGEFAGDAGVYSFSGHLQTIADAELTQLKNENLKLQGQVGDTAEKLRLANERFDTIEKRAGVLDMRMEAASNRLDALDHHLERFDARQVLLAKAEPFLAKRLSPFPKQEVDISVCTTEPRLGKEFEEIIGTIDKLLPILNNNAGWLARAGGGGIRSSQLESLPIDCLGINSPEKYPHAYMKLWEGGISVLVSSKARKSTRDAANALSTALSEVVPFTPKAPKELDVGSISVDTPYTLEPIKRLVTTPNTIQIVIGKRPQ